jgi:hypothetical protein
MKYSLAMYKDGEHQYDIDICPKDTKDELRSIVDFTTSFENPEALKGYLEQQSLISPDDDISGLRICKYQSKNSKPALIPHGIAYKEDAKYFSYGYVLDYYKGHITDLNFMNTFLKTYYDRYKDILAFSDILYLKYFQRTLETYGHVTDEELNRARGAMGFFVKRFCFRETTIENKAKNKGTKTLYTTKNNKEYKQSFLATIELAMLAIDYEREKDPNLQINKNIEEIKKLRVQLEYYKDLLEKCANNEEYLAYLSQIDTIEQEIRKRS